MLKKISETRNITPINAILESDRERIMADFASAGMRAVRIKTRIPSIPPIKNNHLALILIGHLAIIISTE